MSRNAEGPSIARRKDKGRLPSAPRTPSGERVAPSRQNRLFFLTILLGILFLSALLFQPFFVAVLAGLLLAYFTYPVFRAVRFLLRLRGLSAIISLLVVLGLFVFPFVALGVVLVDDAQDFAQDLADSEPPDFVLHAVDIYITTRVADPDNVTQVEAEKEAFIQGLVGQASTFLIDNLPEVITLIGDFLLGLFIIAFIMFYAYVDGGSLIDFLRRTIPLPPHQTDFLLRETRSAVDAIFVGQLASALLQGLVGGIGFWLFGVPNQIFWGAVMALLSLLPVVGAFLVWGPAGIILLAQGDTVNGVMLLLWGAVLVSNVDNVAKPILIGERADIHPVFVLIGVLGGLAVFGFIGFIVGPLVLGIATAFLKVWNEEYHDGTGWVRHDEAPPPPPPPPANDPPVQ